MLEMSSENMSTKTWTHRNWVCSMGVFIENGCSMDINSLFEKCLTGVFIEKGTEWLPPGQPCIQPIRCARQILAGAGMVFFWSTPFHQMISDDYQLLPMVFLWFSYGFTCWVMKIQKYQLLCGAKISMGTAPAIAWSTATKAPDLGEG